MLMMITGQDLSRMLLVEVNYIDHVEVEGTLRLANIPSVTEFKPLSWGLDRIDHQPNQALLNQIYTVIGGGDNVHVYVVDTVLFFGPTIGLLTSSITSVACVCIRNKFNNHLYIINLLLKYVFKNYICLHHSYNFEFNLKEYKKEFKGL